MKINDIVKDILKKHEGGEDFFTALDAAVQNKSILRLLRDLATEHINKSKYYTHEFGIIVSGKFGNFYINSPTEHRICCSQTIVTNGGIRKGAKADILVSEKLPKRFIFIDDSYYSGTTKRGIDKALREQGGKIVHTVVVYDGSKKKLKNVSSLYRYYKD